MAKNGVKKLAKKLKVNTKKIPLREFKRGIKVEREHGPKAKGGISKKTDVTSGSKKKTAKIALAHLKESPRYYQELAKMEDKLERSKNGKKKNKGVKMANRKSINKKNKKICKKGKEKIATVLREFKNKKLHSGSKKGPKVRKRSQAIAIALNEARKLKKKKK